VWKREIDGLQLTFRLAGINNQNFLMRDEQTGSFWQQISGLAISGPLAGRQLALVSSDELSFGLWRSEQPNGTILRDVSNFAARYAPKDWESKMQRNPTVLNYAQAGLQPRTLILGARHNGVARAWPHETILREKLILDQLRGTPLILLLGPDQQSIRAFQVKPSMEFYRLENDPAALMLDNASGSKWNFQGCAVSGPATGTCLKRLDIIKDYWFDWRHYNPATTVFQSPSRKP
jgi:hypothetical protein